MACRSSSPATEPLEEPLSDAHERARKIDPVYAKGRLVRVAGGRNQAEAELIQGLLLEEGVPSMLRRSAGFDVPDFLAAGPRDVLVPESGVAAAARELLLRGRARADRRLPAGAAAVRGPLVLLGAIWAAARSRRWSPGCCRAAAESSRTRRPMRDGSGDAASITPGLRARRSLARIVLAAGAAFIVLALLVLPLPARIDRDSAAVVGICAGVSRRSVQPAPRRCRCWPIPVLLLPVSTVLVSMGIEAWGVEHRPTSGMFYVWIVLYAAYFLPLWQALRAARDRGGSATGSCWRASTPATPAITRWAVTVGTLAIADTVTARLVSRLRVEVARPRARREGARAAAGACCRPPR